MAVGFVQAVPLRLLLGLALEEEQLLLELAVVGLCEEQAVRVEGVADDDDVGLVDVRVGVAVLPLHAAVEQHVHRDDLHLVEEVQVAVDDLALVDAPLGV